MRTLSPRTAAPCLPKAPLAVDLRIRLSSARQSVAKSTGPNTAGCQLAAAPLPSSAVPVLPEGLVSALCQPFPDLPSPSELQALAEQQLGATLHEVYGWLLRPACRAGCYALTTPLALGLPVNPWVAAALFSSAFLAYAWDRVKEVGGSGDQANHSKRSAFMHRHAPAIYSCMAAAAAVIAAAAVHLPAGFAADLAPALGLAMAYTVPLFGNGQSLRTAPGCKTLATCGLWAIGCAWLPVAAAGGLAGAGVGGGAVAAMLLHVATCCLGSVLKDVGDMEGDAADGTRSLPVLLGKRRTLALVAALCGLDAVVSAAMFGRLALLIPNALLAAHALTFDSRRFERVEAWSFYWQLAALALPC